MFKRKKNQPKQVPPQEVAQAPVVQPSRPASAPSSPPASQIPPGAIAAFKSRISDGHDLLYGVALFFEGISLLFDGQDAAIETYRKQCRNVIQQGTDNLQRAEALLDQVRKDSAMAPRLERFKFMEFAGQADLEEMAGRAEILVQTYKRLYPNRSRSEPFKQEEILKIMDEASSQWSVASGQ